MDIILKEDIAKLGFKDDIVSVRPGYARNYLIPHGFAVAASGSQRKVHEENLRQRAHKLSKVREDAEAMASSIGDLNLKIGAKVGESGKIFGSVNTIQVADALNKAGFDIDRKKITIKNEPIKEVGAYEAEVALHKDIVQTVKFEVVEE